MYWIDIWLFASDDLKKMKLKFIFRLELYLGIRHGNLNLIQSMQHLPDSTDMSGDSNIRRRVTSRRSKCLARGN